jgi:hypothetical protein
VKPKAMKLIHKIFSFLINDWTVYKEDFVTFIGFNRSGVAYFDIKYSPSRNKYKYCERFYPEGESPSHRSPKMNKFIRETYQLNCKRNSFDKDCLPGNEHNCPIIKDCERSKMLYEKKPTYKH